MLNYCSIFKQDIFPFLQETEQKEDRDARKESHESLSARLEAKVKECEYCVIMIVMLDFANILMLFCRAVYTWFNAGFNENKLKFMNYFVYVLKTKI